MPFLLIPIIVHVGLSIIISAFFLLGLCCLAVDQDQRAGERPKSDDAGISFWELYRNQILIIIENLPNLTILIMFIMACDQKKSYEQKSDTLYIFCFIITGLFALKWLLILFYSEKIQSNDKTKIKDNNKFITCFLEAPDPKRQSQGLVRALKTQNSLKKTFFF